MADEHRHKEELSHTPGPWRAMNHSWSETSIASPDRLIALLSIESTATEETQEVEEAQMARDAALLAAAPDLLEELKNMVDIFEGYQGIEWKRAKAAIAKAEGK